jgi:hypothetical protein
MCQKFVAAAIDTISIQKLMSFITYDILINHPSDFTLLLILADLTKNLDAWDLCIVLEKEQKMSLNI